MLTCLENPGDRGPAVRAGADPRPVSRPQRRGGGAQVDRAMALVAEGQLGGGAVRMRNRRRAETEGEDISWLVHLSNLGNGQYSPASSWLAPPLPLRSLIPPSPVP